MELFTRLHAMSVARNSPLVFPLGASGQRIVLTAPVLGHFLAHRQLRPWAAEAGGQLFASIHDRDLEVMMATGPRRSDRRTRWSYMPDAQTERAEIKKSYRKGLHFIGDWHTHPQTVPSPSGQDLTSLRQCFLQSIHRLNAFILIVVGRADFPAGLYVAAVDGQGSYELTSERAIGVSIGVSRD